MWEMIFTSFLTLLVVNVVVAGWVSLEFVLPLPGRSRVLPREGCGGLGRRLLGSSVLGHWLWKIQSVYLVPAIPGAISAIPLNMLCWNTSAMLFGAGLGAVEESRRKPVA